jgi:DNA-binding NarL/FixJ family response regulator
MNEVTAPLVGLPEESLDVLAATLRAVAGERRGIQLLPLVELVRSLPTAVTVTVDFTQAWRLAAPLVVLTLGEFLPPAVLGSLTRRERTVARLVARGWSNKSIARALGLAPSTVKLYVHRILRKAGLPSRAAFASTYSASSSWEHGTSVARS